MCLLFEIDLLLYLFTTDIVRIQCIQTAVMSSCWILPLPSFVMVLRLHLKCFSSDWRDFLAPFDISACSTWFCSFHLVSLTKNNVGDFFMMLEMLGQSHLGAYIANVFWGLLFSVFGRQCHIKMWLEASLSSKGRN